MSFSQTAYRHKLKETAKEILKEAAGYLYILVTPRRTIKVHGLITLDFRQIKMRQVISLKVCSLRHLRVGMT